MARRGSGLLLVLATTALSCGGSPPVRTPDRTLAIAPAPPVAARATEPLAPKRPDTVAAWLHIDDPDALLDLLGAVGPQAQQQTWSQEILPFLEALDLQRPVDGVLVALGGKHDVEPVVRVHLRDARGLVDRLAGELEVREDGDRIHVRDKHDHDEENEDGKSKDLFVCDFTGSGRDVAVCGTAKGVDAVIDWLRTDPSPRDEDGVATTSGAPLARFIGYGEGARKMFKKELDGDRGGDSEVRAVLADARLLSFVLVRDGKRLGLSGTLKLDAARSDFTRDLVEPPNAGGVPAAFDRVSQDTSAAVFVPGGGAVPKWMAELVASSEPTYGVPDATKERVNAAAKALGEAFKKPAVLGYGVRLDKARGALASVRAATKDQEKAVRALEDALEPQMTYALSLDVATAEKLMRELGAAWTAVSQEHERQSAGSGSVYPHPKFAVRPAPAKWGLPKGSFFFDETKADWVHVASTPGGGTAPKTKTEYTLHVQDGALVWGITCVDEKVCVEGAKKILGSGAPAKREPDELFQRKGILCAGYFSSLMGALSLHHHTLANASGPALADALAEIERDLAAPRMVLPFVLTTAKAGDGGTLSFEIRGERDAFRILGEHVGISGSSVFSLLMMLGVLGR